MSKESKKFGCPTVCWIIGAVLGVLVYLIMSGSLGMFFALILALIVAGAAGYMINQTFCLRARKVNKPIKRPEHNIAASPQAVANVDAIDDGQASSMATPKDSKSTRKPKPKPKAKLKAKPAAKPKAAAKTAKPKPKTASKPASKPVVKDSKPKTLSKARAGGADDLKRISGVGPKLEQTLNDLGIYHYDQIAKWQADDIAWVDSRLTFKGRITRDDWMKQAKALMGGK